MSIPTVALDETSPAGSQAISLGDNRIREFKTQVREILEVDHKYESSGQHADMGKHKKVSLLEQANLGTGADGEPILGAQIVSSRSELVYTNEDDVDIQLTKGAYLHLNSGALTNDTYLKGLNAAGSGLIDLIKVNASDICVLPVTAQLAANTAPSDEKGIANKKYVDDQISALNFEIVQTIKTQSATYTALGAGTFPQDDSKPQITEGAAMSNYSTSITPSNSSNWLRIQGLFFISQSGAADRSYIAVFKDGAADAVGFGGGQTQDAVMKPVLLDFWIQAGSTSAQAFTFRVGNASGSEFHINGTASGGARVYGGVLFSQVCITEYKVA